MASKKSSKGSNNLGSLKREIRSALTPSAPESESTQIEEKIDGLQKDINSNFTSLSDSINNKNKESDKNNSTILAAIKGCTDAVEEIIDTLEEYDEIFNGINTNVYDISESITRPFTDFINNINKKNNILNAIVPSDYFKDLHANVGMISDAFNPANTESYVSKVSSHLINIESGVYALAAAIWGWENVSEGNPVKTNIKDTNKDTYKPILETMKAVSEMIEENKKGANKREADTKATTQAVQSPFEAGVEAFCDMMLDETANTNKIVSDIKDLVSSGKDDIVSSLLYIKEDKKNIVEGNTEAPKQQIAPSSPINSTTTGNLGDTKASVENAIEIIKQLETLFDSKHTKGFFAGERNLKRTKRVFNAYKSSLLYIIEETNKLIEQTGEVKGTESIKTVTDTLTLLGSMVNGFSDGETKTVKNNIQNAMSVIGGNDNKDKTTLFSLTDYVSSFASYLNEKSGDLSNVKGAYTLIETISSIINKYKEISDSAAGFDASSVFGFISGADTVNDALLEFAENTGDMAIKLMSAGDSVSVISENIEKFVTLFNKYNELSDAASVKTAIALAIKLMLFDATNGQMCSFADSLSSINIKEKTFDDFIKVSDKILTVLDAMNGFGAKMNHRKAMSMGIGVKQYSKLAHRIVKMAIDVEESLSDIDEKQLNEICGKNGKLVKVGRLAKSLNEISSSLSKGLVVGLIAQIGAKSSKKTLESVVDIVKMLADKEFVSNLEVAVKGREGTTAKITLLSKSLFKVLLNGTLLSTLAIPALIGFKLTDKSMSAVVKIVKTLSELDKKDLDNAVDNLTIIKDISETLIKVLAGGIVLGVLAIPASVGFLLTALAVYSLKLVIKTLTSFGDDELLVSLYNIEAINSLLSETIIVLAKGSLLAVLAVPAFIGFLAAWGAFNFGLKYLVSSISDIFGKDMTEKDTMFKMHAIASIVTSITKICVCGAILLVTAPLALAGFLAAWATFKLGFTVVLKAAMSLFDKSTPEECKENINSVADITKSILKVCVFGAMLSIFAPLAMIGFVVMLPALLALAGVLALVKWVVGDKNDDGSNWAAAKGLGELVLVLAGVMIIGGLLGGVVMKLLPNIIIFTLTLSAFILAVCGALSLATIIGGGLKHLKESATAIIAIVIASSMIMLIGGMIVKAFPDLIFNSFVFTALLAIFLFAIVGTIALGAKLMKGAEKSLVYILAFETITAACLLIPGYIMLKNPGLAEQIGIFLAEFAVMCTILCGVAWFISKRKASIVKAITVMYAMSALMVAAGLTMMEVGVAAKLFNEAGGLAVIGVLISMGVVLCGIAVLSTILQFIDETFNIKKGIAILALLEIVAAGAAGVIWLINKVAMSISDWGQLWATVGTMVAIIAIFGTICGILGALSEVIFIGEIVAAVLVAIVASMALAMKILVSATSDIVELSHSKLDIKGINQIISGMYQIAMELQGFGGLTWGIFTASLAIKAMSSAISDIAEAVQEAADMHYTKYENGKKVGEFNLSEEDFVNAAKNTKSVVSILGQAIIDIYNENPEIFTTGTILGDFIGTQTKFEKVCRSVSMLGKVISKIASGVQDAASLHYTKYENGKKVGEFNLGKGDFQRAAENTKLVIKTLGTAIMEAYDSNPDIFTTNGGSTGNVLLDTLGGIADIFGAETKFGRVAKAVMTLGTLISKISDGVSNMANLTVTEYDENGKEKKRNMNMGDFAMAALNTNMIVTFLGNTIIDVYNKNPELFSSGNAAADMLGFNPKFKNIIETVSALGGLMSSIAGGIQAMAENAIPVYGEGGKIIRKDPIKPSWYTQAATTVANVMTCMGNAIMSVYEQHPDWFAAQGMKSWFMSTSSSNTFTDVAKSLMMTAELIGKYADVVQKFASGKIDLYGPDGKVLGSIPITKNTYRTAAESVALCISTLSESINKTYKDNKELFNEDTFEPLMDNLTAVANLLSKYSEKVKDFANLTYDVYDESGKVVGKKHIGKAEFDNAGESVKSIINTMVTAVNDAYTKHSDLFKDTNADPNKKNSGKTWFEQIINSFLSVGPLISSISKAVQEYATLQVPEYDANGRPTGKTVKMSENHFKEAGNNIQTMVGLMASAIQQVWNNEAQRQMFMNATGWLSGQKDNSNPFYVISTAMTASGTMVEQAAKATKAVLEIPGFENVNDIKKKLDVRIPVMTAALVHAVTESYKQGTDKTTGENIFDNALSDKSPFKKVEAGITAAYNVVMNAMKVYVEAGKLDMSIIDSLTGGESSDPKSNKIYKMVAGLAQPIVDIFNSTNAKDKDGNSLNYNTLFSSAVGSDSYFTKIVKGVEAVAGIMGKVKSAYDQISSFEADVDGTKEKINKMITGLVGAIGDAYNGNKEAFDDAAPLSGFLVKAITMANPVTGIISLFKGNEPDTPAFRVIKALGSVCEIFDGIVKVYKDVAATQFDANETPKKVTNMIQGLASVFNKEKMKGIDFDAAEDGAKMMKDFVEEMEEVMFGEGDEGENGGIFGVYAKLQQMKIGSQQLANNMGLSLKRLVEGLINAVGTPVDFDVHMVRLNFGVLSDTIESIIDIYTLPSKMLGPVMAQSNATDIDGLINNVNQTIMAIPKKMSELMSDASGIMSDSSKVEQLLGSAWNMKRAMKNLGAAVSFIPANTKDVEYFIPFINKLNKELSTIPKLDEFVRETDNLVRFNSSVNSLQVKNVEVLTKLFIEFNKFSSKFGNLDKFTQVLATKMSQCLTYLADQIRDSAKTINKSEEIQKKRQEQIRKTIEEFKKLADQGLEVTVKAAETEAGGGFGGIGGDSSENGQTNGNSQSTSSTSSVQSQSLGSGSTSHSNSTLQQIGSDVAQIARYYRSRQ